jgi:hypothetical protein
MPNRNQRPLTHSSMRSVGVVVVVVVIVVVVVVVVVVQERFLMFLMSIDAPSAAADAPMEDMGERYELRLFEVCVLLCFFVCFCC